MAIVGLFAHPLSVTGAVVLFAASAAAALLELRTVRRLRHADAAREVSS